MDNLIQAATVIAAFAAMHERLVELIQQTGRRLKWWSLEDEPNIDRWNILLAFILAAATHANLVELFKISPDGKTSEFFVHYLAWPTALEEWEAEKQKVFLGVWGRALQEIAGFALMALSTALGSKFWHDLVKGLVDLRDRAKDVKKAAEPMATPPLPPDSPQKKDGISRSSAERPKPVEPPPSPPSSAQDGARTAS
ncbi:hypothetical protein ACLESO_13635 [Pyxidicoccus sp. 3LG]